LRKFVQFERCINEDDQKKILEDATKLQVAILKELDQYQFQLEKESLIYSAIQRDSSNYKDLFKIKEDEISFVRQEIEELKTRLKNEQQNKRNREEYMTLTKLINKHPKRHETEKSINEVKKELASVETRAREILSELDSRSKQFQLVLYAVNLLQEEMAVKNSRKRTIESVPEVSVVPAKKQKLDNLPESNNNNEEVDLNVELQEPEIESVHNTEIVTITEVEETSPVVVEVEDIYIEEEIIDIDQ